MFTYKYNPYANCVIRYVTDDPVEGEVLLADGTWKSFGAYAVITDAEDRPEAIVHFESAVEE
jgi:hypothetical protein